MTQRFLLSAFTTSALIVALPMAGCGGFSADPEGSGGAPASGGADSASGGDAAASGGATSPASGGSGDTGDTGSGGREEVPEATCENVTACDGDPTGTWFAKNSCLKYDGTADIGILGIGCTEVSLTGTMTVDGNFRIDADGTISDNTKTVADLTMELQPECLEVSGVTTTCDRVGGPITDGSGAAAVDCVESTVTEGGCTCTVTFDQTGAMAYPQGFFAKTEGTSTNAGNTLTVTGTLNTEDANSPGPDEVAYALCVDGNFLHVSPVTESTIWGPAVGDIVLQRQE